MEVIADSGWYPSLALDDAGQPHVSYGKGDTLYYAHRVGGAWETETVGALDTGTSARDTSLALDRDGMPRISFGEYRYVSGPSAYEVTRLRYARKTAAGWQAELVDSDDNTGSQSRGVGLYNSLALDAAGRPHISYRDSGNRRLKYARGDGPAYPTSTPMSAPRLRSPRRQRAHRRRPPPCRPQRRLAPRPGRAPPPAQFRRRRPPQWCCYAATCHWYWSQSLLPPPQLSRRPLPRHPPPPGHRRPQSRQPPPPHQRPHRRYRTVAPSLMIFIMLAVAGRLFYPVRPWHPTRQHHHLSCTSSPRRRLSLAWPRFLLRVTRGPGAPTRASRSIKRCRGVASQRARWRFGGLSFGTKMHPTTTTTG